MKLRKMWQFHHKRLGLTLDVDELRADLAIARLRNDDPCWLEDEQIVGTAIFRDFPGTDKKLLAPKVDLFNVSEQLREATRNS